MTGLEFIAMLAQLATIAKTGKELLFGKSRVAVDAEVQRQVDESTASPELQQAVAKISLKVRDSYVLLLKKADDLYLYGMNEPFSRPYDWKDARDRAQYDICGVLELVKQHNSNSLPSDVKNLWDEFACANRQP